MRKKLSIIVSLLLLTSVPVLAYEYGGSTDVPEQPANTDQFSYDLGAGYTFSGGVPDESGRAAFFGSRTIQVNESGTYEYPDLEDSEDSILERYITNEGSNQWGKGTIESTVIQVDDAIVRSNRDGIPYLVDPPHPEANQPENRCGDAITSGMNDERTCPEDHGLPSDDNDDSTTADVANTVTNTFNDVVGEYGVNEIGSVSNVGDSGDDTNDYISYDPDLVGDIAFWAEEHDDDEDPDITGPNQGSDTVVYEDQDWEETPDYFLKDGGTEIWMIYVEKDGTKHIADQSTKDYTYGYSYTDYKYEGTVSDDSCSAPGGWSCDMKDINKPCWSTNDNKITHHTLTTDTEKYTAEGPERFETSEGSDHGSTYGVDEHTPSDFSFDVDVKYNDGSTTEKKDAHDCTDENKNVKEYTGCTNTSWSTPDSPQCDVSYGMADWYKDDSSSEDYNGPLPGKWNDGTENHEWTYEYQDLDFRTEKIWDINPAENPSGNPLPSHYAMFRDTDFKTNEGSAYNVDQSSRDKINVHSHSDGRAYWSFDVDPGSEGFSNDHAVSLSRFKMDVERGSQDFYITRDYHESYDPDGPYGESDGYIAIEHDVINEGQYNEQKSSSRQIVGTTSLFMQRESGLSDSASNIQFTDFVDTGDINVPACPWEETKCVAAVDISMKDLKNWGSINPTDGIRLDVSETYAANESMSVCKMYQQISGSGDLNLGSSDNQQCDFEEGDYTSCTGCGSEDPPEPPPPPPCGSPGERWHTMEGPEVNEDAFTSTNEQEVVDDYEECVQHSQCVYKGSPVDEGYVANVASDTQSGYEVGGGSNDWEVCLNIHHTDKYPDADNGYHSKGAHEFGGQWYDLDDDRVDYYLRPSNDNGGNGGEDDYDGAGHRLISQATESEQENPNHISYYYRRNPNPEHPDWNPRGYTGSGSNKNYYYGFNIEDDCDSDLSGCDDSGVQTNFFYSFIWENQGMRVEDYDHVRSPPVS